jgi:hypothetical protein
VGLALDVSVGLSLDEALGLSLDMSVDVGSAEPSMTIKPDELGDVSGIRLGDPAAVEQPPNATARPTSRPARPSEITRDRRRWPG